MRSVRFPVALRILTMHTLALQTFDQVINAFTVGDVADTTHALVCRWKMSCCQNRQRK